MNRYELRDALDLKNATAAGGDGARATLLAYAYLRGVPYRAVEPVTALDAPAMPPAAAAFHRGQLARQVAARAGGEATRAAVDAWMLVPEPDAQRAARRLRVARAHALARIRRDEHRARRLAT